MLIVLTLSLGSYVGGQHIRQFILFKFRSPILQSLYAPPTKRLLPSILVEMATPEDVTRVAGMNEWYSNDIKICVNQNGHKDVRD